MVQALERENRLRDKVVAIRPTSRVERLRRHYLDAPDRIVLDILRIKTRVMRETEKEPEALRQGKAFAAAVREMPINIYPDELFVGWLFCEPRGANLTWGQALSIEDELDTISSRGINPFLISEKDKRELRSDIIPYYKAHRSGGTMAHWTAGYEKVLEKGILGIKEEAEHRVAKLDLADADDFKKAPFLQAVVIALTAAAEIGNRFAARARELAATEKNPDRKAELAKIAEICDRVPANPARTFYEAVQSIWFVHILHGLDSEHATGMGPGRPDQYLYRYYEKDIKEGRITREHAQELIDCWFMRYSQYYVVWRSDAGSYGTLTPHSPGHHINIGGLKTDGSDGSNELSYMFLEAMMHTPGMTEPTISLLVNSKTPEPLLIKACQLVSMGGGYPMFINQDLRIESLLARNEIIDGPPITLDMARNGASIGCHELVLPDVESGFNFSPLNLGLAMELVLTNGIRRITGKQEGVCSGDPRQFQTFEEVRDAFHRQMVFLMKQGVIDTHHSERFHLPKAFNSALVEGCIEKGVSKEHGGARYNVSSIQTWGRIDAGNSLAAVKNLVFEDRKIAMAQLCDALDKNFQGYDDVRKMCLEMPKYGNDVDCVDEEVAWVTHIVNAEAKKYRSTYGGCKLVAEVPSASYIPAGKPLGALPSGRKAGEPLAPASTPSIGSDVSGPTAVIKSASKVNGAELGQGSTMNIRIDPAVFDKPDGFKRLADLIRVFVDERVDHMQINVVYSDTLRAAQKEPALYKDLTVKVAGYNARFIDLHKELQDSIIARTEHRI